MWSCGVDFGHVVNDLDLQIFHVRVMLRNVAVVGTCNRKRVQGIDGSKGTERQGQMPPHPQRPKFLLIFTCLHKKENFSQCIRQKFVVH